MKAVYIEKPLSIEIRDMAPPVRRAGEALIQTRSLGICGSDVTAYKGTNPTMTYPRIIGHELSGEVLDIEENSQGIRVGDRVVLEPYFSCGKCYPCSIGMVNNCESMNVLGVRMEGGMTEQISHPVKYLHKMPDGMSWEKAAMVEPLSISLHVVHRASVKAGEHVAISGAGTIGLLAAKVCLAYGAIPILMDPVDERLEMARAQGVACTINPAKENATEKIRELTGGRMAEAVLECSGAEAAIKNLVHIAANSARIVFVGWPKADISLPVALFIRKELNLFGSRNSVDEFPESIDMIATGKVDVDSVITQCISLGEIPDTIKDLSQYPERYLKVVALV